MTKYLQNNLRKERFDFGSPVKDTYCYSGQEVVGTQGSWSHCSRTLEAEEMTVGAQLTFSFSLLGNPDPGNGAAHREGKSQRTSLDTPSQAHPQVLSR